MITKQQLEEYAQIKAQIKALQTQEAEYKQDILSYMVENEADKIESDSGTFSLAKRKSWKYPQQINEMEADLTVAKRTAEAKGEAECIENPYFVFKETKID